MKHLTHTLNRIDSLLGWILVGTLVVTVTQIYITALYQLAGPNNIFSSVIFS